MSGYGWYSVGYGNPNGISSAPSTQEHCVVCHQVFFSTEALINHYETHIREEELMNFSAAIRERNFPPNNPLQQQPYLPDLSILSSTTYQVLPQNQAAAAPLVQRSIAFGHIQNQLYLPPSFSPPIACLSNHTIIQQRQMQRRQNLAALNNGNMIRPRDAVDLPPNQAAAASPDEIVLDLGDRENISSTDGSINLELTLGTPRKLNFKDG